MLRCAVRCQNELLRTYLGYQEFRTHINGVFLLRKRSCLFRVVERDRETLVYTPHTTRGDPLNSLNNLSFIQRNVKPRSVTNRLETTLQAGLARLPGMPHAFGLPARYSFTPSSAANLP